MDVLWLSMSPIEYRRKESIRQLAPWLTWAPAAQRHFVFVCTAHAGNEVRQLHDPAKRSRAHVAILMTPSEILGNIDRPCWAHRYRVAGSVYGDVVGGCRRIFLKTRTPLTLQGSTIGFSMGNAIADQYIRLDETSSVDHGGLRRAYSIPYSVGDVQEIVALCQNRDKRMLTRSSQLADQSSNDIWRRGMNRPFFESTAKPLTLEEQISIFGG